MSDICLNNLSIAYGACKALQNITMNIPDRRIIAILGPSGCGKTTLLKSLNRLLDLHEDVTIEGNILVDGENIYDPEADILALRKKMGFLSQRPYPLPMSIYDNIAFGPRVHRMNEQQVIRQIEALEKNNAMLGAAFSGFSSQTDRPRKNAGMDHLVEYYLRLAGLWGEVKDRLRAPAALLSVGQQQRLALARGLAVEPEVILADEPTSALDTVSSKLIEKQFKLLKTRYTIIMVTHILRQARRLADYVIFLYMGELVEHGPAESFFGSPQDERTKAYISGEIS